MEGNVEGALKAAEARDGLFYPYVLRSTLIYSFLCAVYASLANLKKQRLHQP